MGNGLKQLYGYSCLRQIESGSQAKCYLVELPQEGERSGGKHGSGLGILLDLAMQSLDVAFMAAELSKLRGASICSGLLCPLDYRLEEQERYLLFEAPKDLAPQRVFLSKRMGEIAGSELAFSVVEQLAQSLGALHEKGFAHVNISPASVLFCQSEQGGEYPLLINTGLARQSGAEGFEPDMWLLYASNEQLLCSGRESQEAMMRWDVYSFGVLAWKLVFGEFPRMEEAYAQAEKLLVNEPERLEAIVGEDLVRSLEASEALNFGKLPAFAKGWGEDWVKIIRSCLHLDGSLRPANLSQVANSLTSLRRAESGQVGLGGQNELGEAAVVYQKSMRHVPARGGWGRRISLAFLGLSLLAIGVFVLLWLGVKNELLEQKKLAESAKKQAQEELVRATSELKLELDKALREQEQLREQRRGLERSLLQREQFSQRVVNSNGRLLRLIASQSLSNEAGFVTFPVFVEQLREEFTQQAEELRGSLQQLGNSEERVSAKYEQLAMVEQALALFASVQEEPSQALQHLLEARASLVELESQTGDLSKSAWSLGLEVELAMGRQFLKQGEKDWTALEGVVERGEQLLEYFEREEEGDLRAQDYLNKASLLALASELAYERLESLVALDLLSQAADCLAMVDGEIAQKERSLQRLLDYLTKRGQILAEIERDREAWNLLEEALVLFAQVREEHPQWQSSDIKEVRAKLQMARLAQWQGNWAKTQQILEQGLALFEEAKAQNSSEKGEKLSVLDVGAQLLEVELNYELALCLRSLGKQRQGRDKLLEALELMEGLLRLNPQFVQGRLLYALMLRDEALWVSEQRREDGGELTNQNGQFGQNLSRVKGELAPLLKMEGLSKRMQFRLKFFWAELCFDEAFFLSAQEGVEAQEKLSRFQECEKRWQELVRAYPQEALAVDWLEIVQGEVKLWERSVQEQQIQEEAKEEEKAEMEQDDMQNTGLMRGMSLGGLTGSFSGVGASPLSGLAFEAAWLGMKNALKSDDEAKEEGL